MTSFGFLGFSANTYLNSFNIGSNSYLSLVGVSSPIAIFVRSNVLLHADIPSISGTVVEQGINRPKYFLRFTFTSKSVVMNAI